MFKTQLAFLCTVQLGAAFRFEGAWRPGAPDAWQRTVQNCTCKTACQASSNVLSKCDVCKTADDCGFEGFKGRWDYCEYRADADIEKHTFQNKVEDLWKRITEDKTRATGYPFVLGIVKESVQTTFDNWRDEMPAGREKKIHTIGSICKVELKIHRSPFSGLLGEGRQQGFIRMGSAADYKNGGLTPGLGFKFPRTGKHSGDFVALHSLDLGQSWNFFKYNQSNHISPPKGPVALLAKKFNQASQCAPQVGISDLARYSQDGTEHSTPLFPFKLFLVPSTAVQMSEDEKTPDEVHLFMSEIEVGTTLYSVYACQKPMSIEAEMSPTDGGLDAACGEPLFLGDVKTSSQCTTSAYGDASLQIRHQRIEEDWQEKPEYLSGYDAAKACGWGGEITADGAPRKCGHHGGMLSGDLGMAF